jgi:hypothetical protein
MQQQVFGDYMFTQQVQVQFLNLLARSQSFFSYAQAIPIRMTDFTLPACQLVFEVVDDYYRRYHHPPSLRTLEAAITEAVQTGDGVQTQLTPEEYESLISVMGGLWSETELDEDYMQDALLKYIKETRMKQTMARYSDAVQRGIGSQDMLRELSEIKEITPRRSDVKFSSMLGDSHNALIWSEEQILRIPTGISALDKCIMGGLSAANAELGIAVACTGIGKTNFLLNVSLGAALHGYKVLFITLELTQEELQQRYLAMASHVNARHAAAPVGDTWEDDELLCYEFVRNTAIRDSVTCCELLGKGVTVADIDAVIEDWKAHERRVHGTDARCKMVCIDWLDQISPDASKTRAGKDAMDWNVMTGIMQDIKRAVNKHRVACWSVTQGNRSSAYAEKLRMDHTSTAFSKLWHVSVALGITAPVEDTYTAEGVDDDDLLSKSAMDCNRDLTFTIMKNRNGPKVSMKLYQCPSLRLWPSRSMWYTAQKQIREGALHDLFGGMNNI